MTEIDKAAGRLAALAALLPAAGVALRGTVPAVGPAPRPVPPPEPAGPLPAAVLLAVSLAIMAVARRHRVGARRRFGVVGAPSAGVAGRRQPLNRRLLLIGAAVLLGWLLLIALAAWWGGGHPIGPSHRVPDGTGGAPPRPVAPAPVGGTPPPPAAGPHPAAIGPLTGYLLLIVAAGTALAAFALSARRPRPPATEAGAPGAAPAAAPPTLAGAARSGLAAVTDPARDPRSAIIACYAALEAQLYRLPEVAPHDCDTPTEVLDRAIEHRALPAAGATRLVGLFTEARFSSHPMTERHRAEAQAILRAVLDALPVGS